MKKFTSPMSVTTLALAGLLALSGCAAGDGDQAQSTQSAQPSASQSMEGHGHAADGGAPPAGIAAAASPTYAVGDEVVLSADHMPGMKGAKATVSGTFDTTAYAISYTPSDGGEPVSNHKWVVHEELQDPADAPLPDGTEVVVTAEHMPGMKGVTATIDSSTQETVYMVDVQMDGMEMANHKWVVESEMQPAS